jgi:hypothetical protein
MRLRLSVVALFAGCWVGPVSAAAGPLMLYVSPEGSDAWSGTLAAPALDRTDGPLATIAGARDAIRRLKAAGPLRQPVHVSVAAGEYAVTAPIAFGPEDSGTAECPITYAGDASARPVITGGRRVTGFREERGRWVAHIPEVEAGQWTFAALWVNGERRTRARTPNEGYLYTAGQAPPVTDATTGKPASSARVAFRYREGDLEPWARLEDAVVTVYQSWEVGHQRVASLDPVKRVVTFRSPLPWPFDTWGGDVRYAVEDVPEALDAPGEWYLDRATGTLTYIPLPGEDMQTATVIAPIAKQLLVLAGDPAREQLVSHLRFANLRLEHTDWEVPPEGHAAAQAACDIGGAVEAVGARECRLEGCEIAHVGTYGAWLRAGSQDCRLERCEVHDLGAGGVRLGEQVDAATEPEVAQRNTVDNCFIHDGGKIDPGAVGVWIGRTSYNRVTHNEICDLYYTGVSVGWSWGYAPTSAHDNLVEHNHIHDIGRGVLGDMGGVYCLGDSPGTVIRGNLVHDVYDHGTGSLAIYTDEGSTGILIEGNIGYGTTYANFHQHYGRENVVRNNIWALGRDYQLSRARQEEHLSFTFERNIVYFDNGKLLKGGWTNDRFVMDRNLYWDASHPDGDIRFGEATFAEWQARGHDQHSLIADPQFVDPAHYDFRLKPTSPAFALGFVPIDASTIGLYGDRAWVEAPTRLKRVPFIPKPPAPPPPTPVHEGFEDALAGLPPEGVHLSVESVGSIVVTDESAATGKQSLQFTDAPGQQYSFNPHLWYSPSFAEGEMRGSFDVRMGPGAVGHFEWRDYSSGDYRVGPSLTLDASGQLLSQGKALGSAPVGQWLHVEIACRLGGAADGTWTLWAGLLGGEMARYDLTCDARFARLDWVGFIANATTDASYWVDSVEIAPAP